MSIKDSLFPPTIWTGITPNNPSRTVDSAPDSNDWNQIIAEIIATQVRLIIVEDGKNTNSINIGLNESAIASDKAFGVIADNGGPIIAGAPLYMKSAGTFAYADANGTGTREPFGLSRTGGADGLFYSAQFSGRMTLTTTEWDAVAGTTGGLTLGKKYYLSITAGRLTETAPSVTGETVFAAGIAASTTIMIVTMDHEGDIP